MLTLVVLVGSCLPTFAPQTEDSQRSPDTVLASAGTEKVTEAQLQLVAMLSGHSEITAKLRSELTKRLVESRFAVRYLKRNGYKVSSAELRQAAKDARARLKAGGVDLRARMKMLKLVDSDLRRELEVGKLWNRYKVKALTTEVLRARFLERKEQYDGTRVRASQIFLKVPAGDDAAWEKAQRDLNWLRSEITAGKIGFAEAARKHSQSPSAKEGGDVGRFPYSGLMPSDFSARAFALKKGEISRPFRSRFGAHLVMVIDRNAGDLSLEDARPVIYRELEREAWDRIVAAEKTTPERASAAGK